MQTLSDEWVTARKPHRCSLCAERIEVGERHRKWTGKDGCELLTGRYHEECMKVTEIDNWDYIDWESHCDPSGFRARLQELRELGKLARRGGGA